jgi:hypothetical protein
MRIFQRVWVVVVGAFAAYIVGVFYEFFRPALADTVRGTLLEPWFNPSSYQYVMSWLFAIAGLVSAIVAVAMAAPPAPKREPAQADKRMPAAARSQQRAGAKDKAQGKAGEVPGIPTSDFDQAKAEVKPGSGSRPAPDVAPASEQPAPAGAAAGPPEEPPG